MTIFLTGSTGYIGSYVAHGLLEQHNQKLRVLVRAKSQEEGAQRLWQSLQLHMDFPTFHAHLHERIEIVLGDLTAPRLGLDESAFKALAHGTTSIIHCAASLNRKSNKACFNTNLRGTLEVVKLARAAQDHHGLRRFSDVSTTAVTGECKNTIIHEDQAIDWGKSDWDPYSRTKKFCEHMVHELLPDVRCTIFRPSTVLGDSRFPETTQFDMVRAFVFFAKLPVLPLDPLWRMDFVPANYVGAGIVAVHMQDKPEHDAYNLSSGEASPTYAQIVGEMERHGGSRHVFLPQLEKTFGKAVDRLMDTPRAWGIAPGASLMKVFFPYITYNTVFDNTRIQKVLGAPPAAFTSYCHALYEFATKNNFKYPHKPWPAAEAAELNAARKQTALGKAGAGKSEAGKTEAGKSEAGKTEAGKAEAGKSEAGKTEAGKAEAGKGEAGKGERSASSAKKQKRAQPGA